MLKKFYAKTSEVLNAKIVFTPTMMFICLIIIASFFLHGVLLMRIVILNNSLEYQKSSTIINAELYKSCLNGFNSDIKLKSKKYNPEEDEVIVQDFIDAF